MEETCSSLCYILYISACQMYMVATQTVHHHYMAILELEEVLESLLKRECGLRESPG